MQSSIGRRLLPVSRNCPHHPTLRPQRNNPILSSRADLKDLVFLGRNPRARYARVPRTSRYSPSTFVHPFGDKLCFSQTATICSVNSAFPFSSSREYVICVGPKYCRK